MSEQLSIFDKGDNDIFKTVMFSVRYPKLARRVRALRRNHVTLSNPTGSTPVHDSLELLLRSVSMTDVPDWKVGESIKRMLPKAYEFLISLKELIEARQMEDYGESKELDELFGDATEEPKAYDVGTFLDELEGIVSINEIDTFLGMPSDMVALIMYKAIVPYVNEKAGE